MARNRALAALATAGRALTRQTFVNTFTPDGGGQDPFFFYKARTKAASEVTPRRALQLTAVYSCVGLLSDAIAGFELEIVRDNGDVIEELALPSWAQKPNDYTEIFYFFHMLMVSVLLTGNAYVYVERDPATSRIIALHPLHPEWVLPTWHQGLKVYYVAGQILADGYDVVHIPGFVLPGELSGLSPIGLAKEAIGLGLTAEEYGARFFENGAHMSGVIEAPGKFDEESAKVMARTLARNHSGANAHLPGVLTNGAEWKKISVSPEEAQFLETRKFQKSDVALLYRVPAYMVDPTVTSSWGTGITEQNRGLSQFTLQPWVTRFEQSLSVLLPRGQRFRLNMDCLLRGTTKERYEVYKTGVEGGWLCADEIRAQEGDKPLPKGLGKKFYVPTTLREVGAPLPAPAAPPKPAPDPATNDPASTATGDS